MSAKRKPSGFADSCNALLRRAGESEFAASRKRISGRRRQRRSLHPAPVNQRDYAQWPTLRSPAWAIGSMSADVRAVLGRVYGSRDLRQRVPGEPRTGRRLRSEPSEGRGTYTSSTPTLKNAAGSCKRPRTARSSIQGHVGRRRAPSRYVCTSAHGPCT